ncbi:MAG: NAD-dependent protein deacylase [Clostridia bacterium]|nr:NAD-dependent protein deacylase [Clostridia bacterium]
MDEKILALKQMIDEASYVVFFGGAGVSTESGIPDFRSPKAGPAKYEYSFEEILSDRFFYANPAYFWRYYFAEMVKLDAKPNDAHRALARLEETGKLKAVVTQNIDGLHQLAGSKLVYELHGTIHKNRCIKCGKKYSLGDVLKMQPLPRCSCGGLIKPDVVLYGEALDHDCIEGAVSAIERSDLLIVGGTSLTVYPAAGLIDYAGGKLALINRDHVPCRRKPDLEINAPIGKTFAEMFSLS